MTMKKLSTLAIAFLLTIASFAQAPELINYQGVARDNTGTILANQAIGLRISVLQTTSTGTAVYTETHTVTTNQFGLFNIQVGSGTIVTGTVAGISWGTDLYFIKVEMDPAGGSSYVAMGTAQLISVPYALYSKQSGSSLPGPTGATGAQGITGATGLAGANGTNGVTGATGPTGLAGTNGVNGATGATGADGTGYLATSATSVAIATGVKTFTTQAGLAYMTNLRVRVANSSTDYMEGIVASYSGTTLIVVVDRVSGSGTFSAWNIGIAGDPGAVGATGAQGIAGATGVTGATGATGAMGATGATGPTGAGAGATYRWNVFHTYDQNNWACNNDPILFGGINPSNWTDNNALAYQISANKDVQRTLFQRKGYAKENAMIHCNNWVSYSSTNGEVCVVMFRINNTSGSAISWTPFFYYTAYAGWSEMASITVNGANTWSSGTSGQTSVSLSIPSGQVSTVIFVSTSGQPVAGSVRPCRMIFYNNSLILPAGLQYVDDLDTATGGWGN